MAYLGTDPACQQAHRLVLRQVQTRYDDWQEEEIPEEILSKR
jgi:hypothetical protein